MFRKLIFNRISSQQKSFSVKKTTKSEKWKSVIGLEVHAQISTNSKLFSGSETVFGAPLNSCVSLFDASIPGTLPVLNKKCVEAGIKTALALDCRINPISMFDRKHYFYADLPAGYQITQQRAALANDGELSFSVYIPGVTKKPYNKTVRLSQLQLEQDSGKSIHDDLEGRSLVDLNRAGAPLMELVFEPDLENGEEAASLIKELILILKRLGTCNCRMEEGALRVDANISINREGEPLGIRTEVKNIGSVRNVVQAITFEIARQIDIKNSGGIINNETRSWDAVTRKTIPMRDKEVQQDYRFMPEPNLPPLHINISDSNDNKKLIKVSAIRKLLPELPYATRQYLINHLELSQENAIILVNEPTLLEYFYKIKTSNMTTPTKIIANFLINDLLTLCNKNNINIEECKITPEHLIDLTRLMQNDTINLQIAKLILQDLYVTPNNSVIKIITEKKLTQIIDIHEIEELCKECINKNAKAVHQYKNGKKKVLFALAGEVAKISNQRANMSKVMKRLEQLLK